MLQQRHLPTPHPRGLRNLSAFRLHLTSLVNFKTSLPTVPAEWLGYCCLQEFDLGQIFNRFPSWLKWIRGYNSFGVVRLK